MGVRGAARRGGGGVGGVGGLITLGSLPLPRRRAKRRAPSSRVWTELLGPAQETVKNTPRDHDLVWNYPTGVRRTGGRLAWSAGV